MFGGQSLRGDVLDDALLVVNTQLNSFSVGVRINANIIRHLAFPALEDLYFGNHPALRDDSVLPFLSRTQGSLRSFTLATQAVSTYWFRDMVHFTTLKIDQLEQQSRAFPPTLKNLALENWEHDVDGVVGRLGHTMHRKTRASMGTRERTWDRSNYLGGARASRSRASSRSLSIVMLGLRNLQRCGVRIHIGPPGVNYLGEI
ncbi:hypothetical protein C8F04DRAFT_1312117 [Mycena alexandri]|uniref:Uncharacterized protein n=1 Tax=Mycena alexandri TaxID=1745969 RepID=A0AAD6WPC5_9AGAR|nr:hypothetical protein C8F04DRAFT_1312117 [Mycena alexandri]